MALTQIEHPCWFATCDRCGEGDNSEYGTSFHYPSQLEAEGNLRDMDWRQALDGSWLCSECYDEARAEQYACPHGAGSHGRPCCAGDEPVPFTSRHSGSRQPLKD
jgi:hypothetical protein